MILGILSIISVWIFEVPTAWAVIVTIIAAINILGAMCRYADNSR